MGYKHSTNPPIAKLPDFFQGVAYYPDYLQDQQLARTGDGRRTPLTIRRRMEEDYARMRRCGIQLVRIGDFAWSHLEPSSGAFFFDRFQEALDLALSYELSVLFCTPTACPPAWLFTQTPEIAPQNQEGTLASFGSRRHYDPCNAVFRSHAQRLVQELARAFGMHPAIVMWQVDNEWGHHGTSDLLTPSAHSAFHAWLAQRYESIESLNEKWFTSFWSQTYQSFDQIPLPASTPADHNPSLLLDFRRFCTWVYRDFQEEQIQLLKEYAPHTPITHNYIPSFFELCPWEMAEDLDCVGYDHYQIEPHPTPGRSYSQFTLMQSLKKAPFLVLEQQPVQVNWQSLNRRFSYDWLFLWALQGEVLGAAGICYFSWQRFYGGPEQYHDAILNHDVRIPRTPQEAVLDAVREAQRYLPDILPPSEGADVLILHATESAWVHEITAQSDLYCTHRIIDEWCQLFASLGLRVEFIKSIAQLPPHQSKKKILLLPGYAFTLNEEEQSCLERLLQQGGYIISLPRTGCKDAQGKASPLPLAFTSPEDFYLYDAGAHAEDELDPVHSPQGLPLWQGTLWSEHIVLTSPQWVSCATFADGMYAQAPAALRKTLGEGSGLHLHLCSYPLLSEQFRSWILTELQLSPPLFGPLVEHFQAIPLKDALVMLNFSTEELPVRLNRDFRQSHLTSMRLTPLRTLDITMSALEDLTPNIVLPPRSLNVLQ